MHSIFSSNGIEKYRGECKIGLVRVCAQRFMPVEAQEDIKCTHHALHDESMSSRHRSSHFWAPLCGKYPLVCPRRGTQAHEAREHAQNATEAPCHPELCFVFLGCESEALALLHHLGPSRVFLCITPSFEMSEMRMRKGGRGKIN